jgi:hypothetical protein
MLPHKFMESMLESPSAEVHIIGELAMQVLAFKDRRKHKPILGWT